MAEVRTDLELMVSQVDISEVKSLYDHILNGIDIVGCGLSQDIKKQLEVSQ